MEKKLFLINSENERIDLNGYLDIVAYQPEGLGFSLETENISSEASKKITKTHITSTSLSINLLFGKQDRNQTYELYSKFVKFLSKGDLILLYINPNNKKYYRKCVLTELTKNDRNFYLRFNEKITLEFTSPFYEIKNYSEKPVSSDIRASGFLLDTIFPFTFGTLDSEKKSIFNIWNDSVYLTNNKKRMSPLKIKIKAVNKAIKNPYWEIFQDSKLIGSDGFNITLPVGFTLEVSSLFQERTALIYDQENNYSSVFQQQQMERSGFIHAPIGKSTIVFHVQGEKVSCDLYKEVDLF